MLLNWQLQRCSVENVFVYVCPFVSDSSSHTHTHTHTHTQHFNVGIVGTSAKTVAVSLPCSIHTGCFCACEWCFLKCFAYDACTTRVVHRMHIFVFNTASNKNAKSAATTLKCTSKIFKLHRFNAVFVTSICASVWKQTTLILNTCVLWLMLAE